MTVRRKVTTWLDQLLLSDRDAETGEDTRGELICLACCRRVGAAWEPGDDQPLAQWVMWRGEKWLEEHRKRPHDSEGVYLDTRIEGDRPMSCSVVCTECGEQVLPRWEPTCGIELRGWVSNIALPAAREHLEWHAEQRARPRPVEYTAVYPWLMSSRDGLATSAVFDQRPINKMAREGWVVDRVIHRTGWSPMFLMVRPLSRRPEPRRTGSVAGADARLACGLNHDTNDKDDCDDH